ncbi:MAG: creatininase family protein [Chitinophagaceae bacterium]|nr:creatininase family protein [Chitinophagaceae bacterium]
MRPFILKETNWKNIKQEVFEIAVLPWGATEAHNFHLPYGTDIMEADHIAAESARLAWEKGARVIVLPTIPFGVNTGQADILLDINMNPSTQMAILRDIITVLDRQGIHKLLILNSHGGNDFKTMLRELGLVFPNMLLCTTNWFHTLPKKEYFEESGDHADEMETSLMMYLEPHLVLSLQEAGAGHERKNRIQGVREGWAWMERKWSQVTEDTGIGNPYKATPEKGERYFKAVTEKISGLLVDLASANRNDLYE